MYAHIYSIKTNRTQRERSLPAGFIVLYSRGVSESLFLVGLLVGLLLGSLGADAVQTLGRAGLAQGDEGAVLAVSVSDLARLLLLVDLGDRHDITRQLCGHLHLLSLGERERERKQP